MSLILLIQYHIQENKKIKENIQKFFALKEMKK